MSAKKNLESCGLFDSVSIASKTEVSYMNIIEIVHIIELEQFILGYIRFQLVKVLF